MYLSKYRAARVQKDSQKWKKCPETGKWITKIWHKLLTQSKKHKLFTTQEYDKMKY